MKHRTVAGLCVLALSLAAPALAQPPAASLPPITDAMKSLGLRGYALNVADLERERAFYEAAFGMKVASRIPATGTLREYVMNWTGNNADRPAIVLNLVPGARQAGQDAAGRLIIGSADAANLARRAVAAGAKARSAITTGTTMIFDPEGNLIEIFQPPVAAPTTAK